MDTKTILIVDDEQTTRQGLKKTLEIWSAGRFEIMSAADGPEAYDICSKKKIHLMITDVCMLEMNGLMLLKHLKETGHNFVVIIVSGHAEFEYAQEAIRLWVINYILKPISKQKLIEAVEYALETEANNEKIGYMEKVSDKELLKIDREQVSNSSVKKAMAYVDNQLDQQISLKEVADIVHLNASYFSVLFKEQSGLTFSEYVTRKRLQSAKKLLLTTDLSIDEIALKAGYQSAKYFIKVFKEFEEYTPSKYRRLSLLE
jgi:two-component system, response regulator YesN